jgi:hypothetical protein
LNVAFWPEAGGKQYSLECRLSGDELTPCARFRPSDYFANLVFCARA